MSGNLMLLANAGTHTVASPLLRIFGSNGEIVLTLFVSVAILRIIWNHL